ncbi:MAG: triphosphoribosyl-dephospho-CoA synthase [Candidatus Obscuribacterales bacterium]|nr:triphosphoribosyl-dephospho-CoA synthase [Candidatus Obscuribacterales bacterium]
MVGNIQTKLWSADAPPASRALAGADIARGARFGRTLGSNELAKRARLALVAEATLTPKPALVDARSSGAHVDLSLDAMLRSAFALEPFFEEMARLSFGASPELELREALAECGRRAEAAMNNATDGSNAHRGAIWTLGLLISAVAMLGPDTGGVDYAAAAARLASFEDRFAERNVSHGILVERTYGVGGARSEARAGFPHVFFIGLPHLRTRRFSGACETVCRLDALLAIMSSLDDTCLLYRGGPDALHAAKRGAREVILLGGTATETGMTRLLRLDKELLQLGASPGGSADLLAATIFLDSLQALTVEKFASAAEPGF